MQSGDGAVGLSELRRHSGEDLDGSGPIKGIALDWHRGHRPLRESECGRFITETHLRQGEIVKEIVIIRLFFEERFRIAARLAPTFLGGGLVADDGLGPA
ncbi:MAG: hypothetical protein H0X34_00035 [Chthoniobacterales bacterium]|nr:hypothetical protein [Chthoniobacterales bacterium]